MKTQFKLSLLGTSLLVGAAALATPAFAQDQDQEQGRVNERERDEQRALLAHGGTRVMDAELAHKV